MDQLHARVAEIQAAFDGFVGFTGANNTAAIRLQNVERLARLATVTIVIYAIAWDFLCSRMHEWAPIKAIAATQWANVRITNKLHSGIAITVVVIITTIIDQEIAVLVLVITDLLTPGIDGWVLIVAIAPIRHLVVGFGFAQADAGI